MSKAPMPLKHESVPAVLAYLKRAVMRSSDIFKQAKVDPKNRVEMLEERLAKSKEDLRGVTCHEWLSANVTPAGRAKLLNALRRQKANKSPTSQKYGVIRVAISEREALTKLSSKTGIPLGLLLKTMTFAVDTDPELREKIVRLAVAINL